MKFLFDNEPSNRIQLQQWKTKALEKFETKMTDKSQLFPCIPAVQGFSMNHLRYGFASDPRKESSIKELSEILSEYTSAAKALGNYTSLIVFFDTPQDLLLTHNVEQFEQLFWKLLNGLNEVDLINWPKNVPTDPHHSMWEYHYNGEPLFMYCATPAHKNRKSRHFDYFMLAITPRWVLEDFNQLEAYAQKIKSQVRKRIENYDSIHIHPDLNSYGKDDNYEWKQYFLHDGNTALSKCPFHKKPNLD